MKITIPSVMSMMAVCMCLYQAFILLDGAQAIAWVAVAVAFYTQHSAIVTTNEIQDTLDRVVQAGSGLEDNVKKSFRKVADNMRLLNGKVSKVQQKREQDGTDA